MAKFSNTRNKELTDEEREFYRECGRRGGKQVAQNYGSEHMSRIGKMGAEAASTGEPHVPKAKVKVKSKKVDPKKVDDSLSEFI